MFSDLQTTGTAFGAQFNDKAEESYDVEHFKNHIPRSGGFGDDPSPACKISSAIADPVLSSRFACERRGK